MRSRIYSNNIVQGYAKVHLGDNYYLYPGHIDTEVGGTLSLKRERPLDFYAKKSPACEEQSPELVLQKLGKFSKSIKDQRVGKDAKKIVRRIGVVLDAMREEMCVGNHAESDDSELDHDSDDFESIDNCLTVARRVDINSDFRQKGHTKLARIVRKRDGCWRISLTSTTFESRNSDGTQLFESTFVLYLEPRSSSTGSPITAYFVERTKNLEPTFLSPVVFAYRIVPNDLEVFQVIKRDDIGRLRELLEDQQATLRGCDEANRSLLYVSE